MVVTRKASGIPPPPTSRTNSSQPIPRAAKGKAVQSSNVPGISGLLVNGETRSKVLESEPLTKGEANDSSSHKPSRPRHKKGKKGGKSGKKKSRPGLVDVISHVLLLFFIIYTVSVCPNDTSVQSPICRGLYEYRRLVLERYVFPPINYGLSHPSVAPYVVKAKPHYEKAVAIVQPVLARTHQEWNMRVVPQWKKRIVPQLNQLNKKFDPYRSQIMAVYAAKVSPRLTLVQTKLRLWSVQVSPYIHATAMKTQKGYDKAKPYATPVWRQVKELVRRALLQARAWKREFVDSHVARIWEKVVELSSGNTAPSPTRGEESSAVPVVSKFENTSTTGPMKSLSTAPSEKTTTTAVASSTLVEVSALRSSTEVIASPSSVFPETTESESTSPTPSSVAAETFESVADKTSSSLGTDDTSVAYSDGDDAQLDLDDLYRELELLDTDDNTVTLTQQPTSEHIQMEEEKAEEERLRKIETARKRADIEGRHMKWEIKQKEVGVEMEQQLKESLVAIREDAVLEFLEGKTDMADVESLAKEATRYLRSAEMYLKNVEKEDKPMVEKTRIWDKAVVKIEEKFQTRLSEIRSVVGAWYAVVVDKEIQAVQSTSAAVRDVGDKGQADIGLDYAWLDDVTVDDWSRYHDLMRYYEDFLHIANSIQNGTHPSAPVNPLSKALKDLQTELEDITIGFETRLHGIKRDAQRSFRDDDQTDGEKSTLPHESEVSILPVPGDERTKTDTIPDGPLFIIGKSKKQVEEALGTFDAEVMEAEKFGEATTEKVEKAAEVDQSTDTAASVHVEL